MPAPVLPPIQTLRVPGGAVVVWWDGELCAGAGRGPPVASRCPPVASRCPPLPRRIRLLTARHPRVLLLGPHPQVTDLVPVIQDNMDLRCLKLRGCALDDATAQQLSSAIAFNTSLVSLDLRDNCISGKWSAAGTSLLLRACRRPTRPAHAWQLQVLWQGRLELCCAPEPEPAALPRSLLPLPACSSPAGMGAAYLANALRNHNSTLLACDLRGGCCGMLQSSSQQAAALITCRWELTAFGNAG